jgi:tryptophan-rich sensory protein
LTVKSISCIRLAVPETSGSTPRCGGKLLTPFYIFLIRAILGILFAVLATRLFYPEAGVIRIMVVAAILVGMAYIFESYRKRKKEP